MSDNERSHDEAARLFHDTWRLLSDLSALQKRLPAPNRTSARRPPDWNESLSYAECVETLRAGIRGTLHVVGRNLRTREESQILEALLPPGAKHLRDALGWIRWLEETSRGEGA
jgi:hypothetical protein